MQRELACTEEYKHQPHHSWIHVIPFRSPFSMSQAARRPALRSLGLKRGADSVPKFTIQNLSSETPQLHWHDHRRQTPRMPSYTGTQTNLGRSLSSGNQTMGTTLSAPWSHGVKENFSPDRREDWVCLGTILGLFPRDDEERRLVAIVE